MRIYTIPPISLVREGTFLMYYKLYQLVLWKSWELPGARDKLYNSSETTVELFSPCFSSCHRSCAFMHIQIHEESQTIINYRLCHFHGSPEMNINYSISKVVQTWAVEIDYWSSAKTVNCPTSDTAVHRRALQYLRTSCIEWRHSAVNLHIEQLCYESSSNTTPLQSAEQYSSAVNRRESLNATYNYTLQTLRRVIVITRQYRIALCESRWVKHTLSAEMREFVSWHIFKARQWITSALSV